MKVGIQNKEGRLILVWNDGTRRTMAISLPDTPRRNLLTTSEALITTRLPSIIEKAPPVALRVI